MSDQPEFLGNTKDPSVYYTGGPQKATGYEDPRARYANVLSSIQTPSLSSGYDTQVHEIPENLRGIVSYNPGRIIRNEGETFEPGDWNIDWSKLPKPSNPYGQNMMHAFDSEETYNRFKSNPQAYMQSIAKANKGKVPEGMTPQWDPNFGWVVHSGAANSMLKAKQDALPMSKFSNAFVQQALPALASMTMGGLGMPSWASSVVRGAKSLGQGQRPLSVLGNAALGYGLGQLGNMMGGGKGLQFGNSLSKLYGLFNSPGNTRMNMGYRPTIPAPNWYNNLRGR